MTNLKQIECASYFVVLAKRQPIQVDTSRSTSAMIEVTVRPPYSQRFIRSQLAGRRQTAGGEDRVRASRQILTRHHRAVGEAAAAARGHGRRQRAVPRPVGAVVYTAAVEAALQQVPEVGDVLVLFVFGKRTQQIRLHAL